ncbi:tetratricopeptide repeat protein [Chitinolyticbacter meiyuanensis]|uniref:tetratricopeptide repeat protein n=1 Tax=Chitinolyticbacter meiyuanensis TaxID=682798 RepID=UPI0011E5C152|nr:tetratricopeptide repeat protein [Chitinolyticbacter meiyuanensis]
MLLPALRTDHARQLAEIESAIFIEPTRARRLCLQLLDSARHSHDPEALIRGALQLSLIEDQLGEVREAQFALLEALAHCEEFGFLAQEAAVLEQLGRCHYTLGDYQQALAHWEQCVRLCQGKPDLLRVSTQALVGLGQLCDACGEHGQAVSMHAAADARLTDINDAYLAAMVKINLGYNHFQTGDQDGAEATLQQAIVLCRSHGFPHHEAEALYRLAEVRIAQSRLDEAAMLVADGLMLVADTPYHWGEVNLLALHAQLLAQHDELDAAMQATLRALDIARQDGMRHLQVRLHMQLADYAGRSGKPALHDEHLRHSQELRIHLETVSPARTQPSLGHLGQLLVTAGRS